MSATLPNARIKAAGAKRDGSYRRAAVNEDESNYLARVWAYSAHVYMHVCVLSLSRKKVPRSSTTTRARLHFPLLSREFVSRHYAD